MLLFTAKVVTGTCPAGFTPGSYGVGKCYALFRDAVQMAVAVLMCQDLAAAATASQARLLTIQSATEEAFLKSFIGNNSISPSTSHAAVTVQELERTQYVSRRHGAGPRAHPARLTPPSRRRS